MKKTKVLSALLLCCSFCLSSIANAGDTTNRIKPKEDYFETVSMSIRAFYLYHWQMPDNAEELKNFTAEWLKANGFDQKYIDKKLRKMHNSALHFMPSENTLVLADKSNKCIWIEPDNICNLALSDNQDKRSRFYSFLPVLIDNCGKIDMNLCEDFELKLDSVRSIYPNYININRCDTSSQVVVLQYTEDKGFESVCDNDIDDVIC